MQTEARLEALSTALDAANRADLAVRGGAMDGPSVRRMISTTNVLLDACIDVGMSHDEPDHVEWASVRLAQWLVAA